MTNVDHFISITGSGTAINYPVTGGGPLVGVQSSGSTTLGQPLGVRTSGVSDIAMERVLLGERSPSLTAEHQRCEALQGRCAEMA